MKGYTPPPRMVVSNEPQPITRSITITEGISVKDLAEKLEIRAKDLISRLLAKGVFATINQTLDAELAGEMARFFGADTNVITFEEQTAKEIDDAAAAGESSVPETGIRPPVVTIMGHVDHGKTTLLDAIRITNVAGGEAGGITQHIGAYKVRITDKESPAFGREIVFLDTPGHEAFTRMRSRGAKATDIVVLVVAADDGVMPQTVEAIDHAHAAEVPIIVAVNKIDKENALPDRVKKQLGDRGLVPEEWGGKTVFVDVSAKKKTNLNLLMEMICLVADLGELKATPERAATGVVLEAKLDRGRGPVATVLVQNGTLNAGDNFVVGNVYGKVRAMFGGNYRHGILAAGGGSVRGGGRSRQGAGHLRISRAEIPRGHAGQEFPRIAGRIGGADQGGGHQGTEHHPEGRRARFGGSDHRLADPAVEREGSLEAIALGCGRDHRDRRAAGLGVERHHHWVQRAAGAQGAGNCRAGKSRYPPALDHLRIAG
jgi:small GTP-binding protein